MKYSLLALLTLCVISGCVAKKPVKVDVPGKCILGGVVDASECKVFSKDALVCNGVVVKIACVEVKK
jgi:hypothetical protein